LKNNKEYNLPEEIRNEVFKSSHRDYSEGFFFGKPKESLDSSLPIMTHDFIAVVLENSKDGLTKVEMRNKFSVGDQLEMLCVDGDAFGKKIEIEKIVNSKGEEVDSAKVVQEKVVVPCKFNLRAGDILRR
jgi:putative protease